MQEERLQKIIAEFTEIENQLSDPNIAGNMPKMIQLSRKRAELEPKVQLARDFLRAVGAEKEANEVLANEQDPEMRELAQTEIEQSKNTQIRLEQELRKALLPADPNDQKDVIIEIRGGAGGDEASLFAGELGRAYLRYAENNGFKTEFITKTDTENGGAKEWVFRVIGAGAYSKFKYESGVHRVQRIPVTESQGRVHTSTCSVAVLPEMEEVEIDIKDGELRIDVFRSSGNGGQSVNTTDSAVRITHLPTGIIVTCQDEKSQLKNKKAALSVLRSRLWQIEDEKRQRENREARLNQIGTGDRSEKIRTYNFPQSRVTDHRIKQSWSNIDGIMEGNFEPITEAITEANAERLLEKETK